MIMVLSHVIIPRFSADVFDAIAEVFARYLFHGCCWTLILPLSNLTLLSPTSNKSHFPPPKHCLTVVKDAPAAFDLLVAPPPAFHCQCTEYRLSAEHPFVVAWRV